MIRVGAVNIDTSHPAGFAESMKKDGRMGYVGVYDDSFRSDAEVEQFIAGYGLERRCTDLKELAGMCDVGFIHGCNWDDHLRCALPFIELGKPVFLDKPMAGSVSDCCRIRELAQAGAVILGASSARYATQIQDFLAIDPEERGNIITVYGTAGVDEFNYGIHIAEAIGGIMGSGAEYVRYAGSGEESGQDARSFYIHFRDGRSAIYTTLTGAWQRFALQVLTTRTTYQMIIDPAGTYPALIGQIANYMEGKPHSLASVDTLLESVEIMLAGEASRMAGGKTVWLNRLEEETVSFDGLNFWKNYQKSLYRSKTV